MKLFARKFRSKHHETRGGEEPAFAQVLVDAFVEEYDTMKGEYDQMRKEDQDEFMEILGGDISESFGNSATELEMAMGNLDDEEAE